MNIHATIKNMVLIGLISTFIPFGIVNATEFVQDAKNAAINANIAAKVASEPAHHSDSFATNACTATRALFNNTLIIARTLNNSIVHYPKISLTVSCILTWYLCKWWHSNTSETTTTTTSRRTVS